MHNQNNNNKKKNQTLYLFLIITFNQRDIQCVLRQEIVSLSKFCEKINFSCFLYLKLFHMFQIFKTVTYFCFHHLFSFLHTSLVLKIKCKVILFRNYLRSNLWIYNVKLIFKVEILSSCSDCILSVVQILFQQISWNFKYAFLKQLEKIMIKYLRWHFIKS